MVYIEPKKRNSGIYYYHTRGVRIGNIIKKYRRYIGKDKIQAQSFIEFKKSLEGFSQKELESIPKNYIDYRLTYSKNVIEDIFKNNILISNIKEFEPNIALEIDRDFPIEFIYNSNNIEE